MKKQAPYKFRLSDGRYEKVDPRPVSIPIGMERPESLQEKMRRLIRDEVLQQKLAADGVETFEEADDFDIPDDPADPATPYEEHFDPKGMTAREQEVRAGFVQDVPEERLRKAKATLDNYKPQRRANDKRRRREDDEVKK